MRREDAPVAGWYPDPRNRMVLRWWDGLDWTEARRAPPSEAELQAHQARQAEERRTSAARAAAAHATPVPQHTSYVPPAPPVDTREVVEQVRAATRGEIDRAADLFSQRARSLQRDITPLVSEYTNRLIRWIRFAAIMAVLLLVAYFVFQVVAQASLFEWIGDRIDNIFNDTEGG